MDFLSNEITFGDFDGYGHKDEVYQILHGSRHADGGKVEFPWDSRDSSGSGTAQGNAGDMHQQKMEDSLGVMRETYCNQDSEIGLSMNTHYSDSHSENYNHIPEGKQRRNKKRRPPGYYEKLQEEIEAERTQKMSSSFDMREEQNVQMYDNSYSSQCDNNNSDAITVRNVNTPYHHDYSGVSTVHNSYRVNFTESESVDHVTDVSRVTISSNIKFSPSNIVHESKELYPHSSSFHISQSSSQQPQVPQNFTDTPEQSCDSHPSSHDQNSDSHTDNESFKSLQDTSTQQSSSGSISSTVNELTCDGERENSTMDCNSCVQENENVVDFTSYPPLQSVSNNIPLGNPVKQASPDKQCVENETPDPPSIVRNEQAGSVWGGKSKTWANLFKGNEDASVIHTHSDNYSDIDYTTYDQENSAKEKQILDMSPVPAIHDSAADILGEFFSQYKILHTQVGLQPRGLMNRGNWCYINATLQALISCPPFYNLLKKMPTFPPLRRGPSSTPILDSLVQLVGEFTPCARIERVKGKRPELPPGPMFEPTYVYKMLQVLQDTSTFRLGRQEDAEEFLSCILDGMHEEMLACMRVHKGESDDKAYEANGLGDNSGGEEDTESWEQVGPKKKSVLTRKNDFAISPLADIFVGYSRSAVYKTTSKDSATVEPFFTLKLDIQSEKVNTVREALERMVSKESVSGFTCSKTNAEMEITKRMTLEQLPPVLILHLKCFVYDKNGGCQKVIKDITFTVDLEITRDLLSPNVRNKSSNQQRFYKLFAVVYHHGKKATGGHYTTAVFHPAINGWVNYDDSNVKVVPVTNVLQFSGLRVPYLLYYRRVDLH